MLSPAFLFYKAYPILVIHFCHNPCLAFKTLLLGVVIVHVKSIFVTNLGCDLLLTQKRRPLSALLLNSMPSFVLEGINKLIKISLVKSLAHHDKSSWDIVVPIQASTFASESL